MRFDLSHTVVFALTTLAVFTVMMWSTQSMNTVSPVDRVMPTALYPDTSRGKALIWVITRDAYTSCQQPAYALRRVKARHGDDVSLVVWYREHDGAIVDRILTRERLSADTAALDVQAYAQWQQHPPQPALHLVEDRTLVRSWTYTDHPVQVKDIASLL